MADRNLNIRVAFSALNNMSRPVNAARQSAAALASQINQTKTSIKGLERQATSFDRLTAANKKPPNNWPRRKNRPGKWLRLMARYASAAPNRLPPSISNVQPFAS